MHVLTVWNHNLTSALSNQPESYQKRALRIIYGDQIKGMPYQNTLFLANLESLKDRRIKLSQSFFKKILSTNSCLHTLLPPEHNNEVLSKLRKPLKYPVPFSTTKRYQSFLNYALAHFQNNKWMCFILRFMLWTVYCIICILYRVSIVPYAYTVHCM